MAHLFEVLEFPDGSRMTNVWNNTWADEARGDEVASGHFIELGAEQDVGVESDFLSSHLPFTVAGLGGLYPDGKPWMFVMQKASAGGTPGLLGEVDPHGVRCAVDPHGVLGDSLDRALAFNPEAVAVRELCWSRSDLVAVYEREGVAAGSVGRWSVADLLRGLLAQCSGVPLADLVAGYPDCAYGGALHPCESDVFGDVFAAWARRQG